MLRQWPACVQSIQDPFPVKGNEQNQNTRHQRQLAAAMIVLKYHKSFIYRMNQSYRCQTL